MNFNSRRPSFVSRAVQTGFTLVEMLIVVLIIAVIAAIAYPAYQNSVVNSRRRAAEGCLLEQAQFMERYYTTNLSYTGAQPPACAAGTDVSNHYTVTPTIAGDGRSFSIAATPINRQLALDTKCGTLGITNTGAKSKTGTDTLDYCW